MEVGAWSQMSGSRHWLGSVLVGLCAAALPYVATAYTAVYTHAYTNGTVNSVLTDTHSLNGGPGQAVSASSYMINAGPLYSSVPPYPPVGSQSGEASASASAVEGTLSTVATANAGTAGLVQNAMGAQAFARASWNDGLLLDAGSALHGQAGTITAVLAVSGSLGGGIGPDPNAFVDLSARLSGTGLPPLDLMTIDPILRNGCQSSAYCDRQYSGPGNFGGVYTVSTVTYSNFTPLIDVTIPVTFGYQTSLSYTLDLYAYPSASTGTGGPATAAGGSVDYGNTLRWAGVAGVFDASGHPVTGFTATSTSGYDYFATVPEPGAAPSMLLGLTGLAVLRRRR